MKCIKCSSEQIVSRKMCQTCFLKTFTKSANRLLRQFVKGGQTIFVVNDQSVQGALSEHLVRTLVDFALTIITISDARNAQKGGRIIHPLSMTDIVSSAFKAMANAQTISIDKRFSILREFTSAECKVYADAKKLAYQSKGPKSPAEDFISFFENKYPESIHGFNSTFRQFPNK